MSSVYFMKSGVRVHTQKVSLVSVNSFNLVFFLINNNNDNLLYYNTRMIGLPCTNFICVQ